MNFEIIGSIVAVEVIALRPSIRNLRSLRSQYGGRRWRKLKGVARVRLANGDLRRAEVHWYEAHGIGRVRLKLKRFLD